MKVMKVLEVASGLGQVLSIRVPARASFHLAVAADTVAPITRAFRKAERQLLEEHGERDPKGEFVADPGGGFRLTEEGEARKRELLEEEVDVELPKIPLSAFGQAEIPPRAMRELRVLIADS